MHERRRAQRRLAGRRGVQLEAERVPDRVPVDRRQLHEEVVRMLAVVQRGAAVGLAALEQERKLQISAHRRGLEGQHRTEQELTAQQRVRGHAHDPVDRRKPARAAIAPLHVVAGLHRVVQHQHPVARHEVMREHGRGVGHPAGAGSFAAVRDAKGRSWLFLLGVLRLRAGVMLMLLREHCARPGQRDDADEDQYGCLLEHASLPSECRG